MERLRAALLDVADQCGDIVKALQPIGARPDTADLFDSKAGCLDELDSFGDRKLKCVLRLRIARILRYGPVRGVQADVSAGLHHAIGLLQEALQILAIEMLDVLAGEQDVDRCARDIGHVRDRIGNPTHVWRQIVGAGREELHAVVKGHGPIFLLDPVEVPPPGTAG